MITFKHIHNVHDCNYALHNSVHSLSVVKSGASHDVTQCRCLLWLQLQPCTFEGSTQKPRPLAGALEELEASQ